MLAQRVFPFAAGLLLTFIGIARCSAQSKDLLPVSSPRWRVPTVNDPIDEELVQGLTTKFAKSGSLAIPAFQPLSVGDAILMRSPERLLAIDFRTGRRIWEFPWSFEAPAAPAVVGRVRRPRTSPESRRLNFLTHRLWHDTAYSRISTDGRQVFLLDELGDIGERGAASRLSRSSNRLVALDVSRQGALEWSVGRAVDHFNDEPRLADAYFLGAPLAVDGKLYALAELDSKIQLVVLAAGTGRLDWSLAIADLEDSEQDRRSFRRLAGATPALAEGMIVCPTSTGVVVGVNAVTHVGAWRYEYKTDFRLAEERIYSGTFTAGAPGDRWAEPNVVIHDGRAMVTAVESDKLHCIDLKTGKLARPTSDRGDALLMADAGDGIILLLGKSGVRALRISDGQEAWMDPGMLAAEPSGRGVRAEKFYYLPTATKEVIKIDITGGKIVGRAKTDHVLGNLAVHQGEIISHGVDWITSSAARPTRDD